MIRIRLRHDILEKHIKNIADDEVLVATLNFRDEEDLTSYGIFSEPFRTYEKLMDFVTTVADDDNVQERMWVEVVKYKIHNGEYKDILRCNFSVNGEMIGVRYNVLFFGDEQESREIKKIQDFLSYQRNVLLPFERGDIVYMDAAP